MRRELYVEKEEKLMNSSLTESLAIFNGIPAFSEILHVGRPNIGSRERLLNRITDMLNRRWLTNSGPYVVDFERRVADFLNVKHCVAMCNGTVALEIAIRALELKGEVIIPSFTFIATAHALQWQEITPIFCDVDPYTHTIDPNRVEEMITPRTSGIMGVHIWGRPCDTKKLSDIAQRHNLHLLFDAAHAFGTSHDGKMIGNFGDAEVFSFHATKFMNSGEGGVVVTNNDDLAEKMRLMKNFGFAGYDNVIYIGINGKMTEMSAAMGLTNLESIDEFVAENWRNYQCYQEELVGIPGINLISYNCAEKCNYQYIALEVDEIKGGLHRDMLQKVCHAENVLARRYFYPGCHRMEPYCSYFPHARLLLPETERLTSRMLLLPTGSSISTDAIKKICTILRIAIEHAEAVRIRLAQAIFK